jgi:hypothetical protein
MRSANGRYVGGCGEVARELTPACQRPHHDDDARLAFVDVGAIRSDLAKGIRDTRHGAATVLPLLDVRVRTVVAAGLSCVEIAVGYQHVIDAICRDVAGRWISALSRYSCAAV